MTKQNEYEQRISNLEEIINLMVRLIALPHWCRQEREKILEEIRERRIHR